MDMLCPSDFVNICRKLFARIWEAQ